MTFCRSWMLKAMPKRNLGQKELCLILTQLRKTADGVWWEVSLIPPTRTHLHLHRRRRGGGAPAKGIPITAIHLFAPSRNLKAWNFTLVATTSCKNVETLPRKNDLSCFKSLLVKGLWDIILTSLLPPIQSFLHKGQRNITSTRSWTGHLCQSQVLLQLVVAFTWAPHKFFSNNF